MTCEAVVMSGLYKERSTYYVILCGKRMKRESDKNIIYCRVENHDWPRNTLAVLPTPKSQIYTWFSRWWGNFIYNLLIKTPQNYIECSFCFVLLASKTLLHRVPFFRVYGAFCFYGVKLDLRCWIKCLTYPKFMPQVREFVRHRKPS